MRKTIFWFLVVIAAGFLVYRAFWRRPAVLETRLFDEVTILVHADGASVRYQDGTVKPLDGAMLSRVDWEEYRSQSRLTLPHGARKDDFPVIMFSNASGVDLTNRVVAVRRVRDGGLLHKVDDTALTRMRFAVIHADSTLTVVHDDGVSRQVDQKTWSGEYLGIDVNSPVHAPKEFEKLSDADLKKLGYERLSPEAYRQRFGREPPPEGTVMPIQSPAGRP